MGSALDTQLLLACAAGDVVRVKQLLKDGADIHFSNDQSLMNAALNGHAKIVTFLLNHEPPADIHAKDDYALRWAAQSGHADVVTILLNHRDPADIHALDDNALQMATINGRTGIVRILLRHRDPADVHAKNDNAFISAVGGEYKEVGIELLRYGANQFDNQRVREWVGEMSRRAKGLFSGGVSEDTCFTDGNLSDAVLDACATQQFGTLIGTPLLVAKNYALFKRVWEALPECWQAANLSLYGQFSRAAYATGRGK